MYHAEGEAECIQGFGGKFRSKETTRKTMTVGWRVLKWILHKLGCYELIWLRIGASGELL
jgi:hypothetical protein